MGLASRKLGVPVRWIEDRLEHLAASSSASGRVTHVEAGLHLRGRARRAPLRRDRGRRRVRPRARAGDALPHARLALGRVPRAERGRTQPRRAHEHDARAASTAASAARSSISRSSGRWRSRRTGSGSTRPSSAPQPDPGGRVPVPDAVGRRSTTRATTRPASTTRSSSRATTSARRAAQRAPTDASSASGSPASSSRRSRTWATSRSPRPAASARRPAEVRETPRACTIVVSPLGGDHRADRRRRRRDRATARSSPRSSPTSSASSRRTSRCSPRWTRDSPWTVASGNYSSRFSGVGVGRGRGSQPSRLAREDRARSASHLGDEIASLRRVAGTAHWNPESLPTGWSPGSR